MGGMSAAPVMDVGRREEALRQAQDESWALEVQRREEEALLQEALGDLGVRDGVDSAQGRGAAEELTEASLLVRREPEEMYECQICMEEYPWQEIFMVQPRSLCFSVRVRSSLSADTGVLSRVLWGLHDELHYNPNQGALHLRTSRSGGLVCGRSSSIGGS